MRTPAFSEWLEQQLRERGWSQSELARRADLAPSSISMLLSARNAPRAETCVAIARGLNLPPEMVLRAAQLLPKGPPSDDPSTVQMADLYRRMSEKEREITLDFAHFMFWRRKRREERRRQGRK